MGQSPARSSLRSEVDVTSVETTETDFVLIPAAVLKTRLLLGVGEITRRRFGRRG
jgi:hypothetical protein